MNTMNSEFFEALAMLEKERGIPVSYLIEKISNAIAIAVKRDMGGSENAIVEIDPEKQRFYVAIRKNVVEEVTDPETEITLSDATKYSRVAHVGGVVEIPLETKQFGRIAAQSAKHVIRQGISEAEKGQLVQKYQDKKYEIISVPVLRGDRQDRGHPAKERAGSRRGAAGRSAHHGLCGGRSDQRKESEADDFPHPSGTD